jgi:hypothetical protein
MIEREGLSTGGRVAPHTLGLFFHHVEREHGLEVGAALHQAFHVNLDADHVALRLWCASRGGELIQRKAQVKWRRDQPSVPA